MTSKQRFQIENVLKQVQSPFFVEQQSNVLTNFQLTFKKGGGYIRLVFFGCLLGKKEGKKERNIYYAITPVFVNRFRRLFFVRKVP